MGLNPTNFDQEVIAQPVFNEKYSRSFDKSQLRIANDMKIESENMIGDETGVFGGRSGNQYDENEVNDMAKTSMFGGHIHSAGLPFSP